MTLLERASQLEALNSSLSQVKAREGQGCVALVYGEAGIGKTSLVEHFLDQHKTKWRILQGACDSLFTPRPLGPLHDIASQLSSSKGAQGNLSALLGSESNRTTIFSACLNELQQQATILVVEDVHWADEATLDLLKYLGRRIRQTVSLLILTYRDDEMGNDHPLRILLGDLASSHALHRVPVSPLSKEAVRELAKNRKVDSLELHRLTNGNPFYVTEVLAVESGIPETVRDAVLARAARLSLSARDVLEAATVIGSRAEAWLLSNIVSAEFVHVEECIAKGMLQSQGEYYAFRHELARQTILETISPQRKITLHRMTLDALKASPETSNDLARLANHAAGTNDANAVLEYAPAAARQASTFGAHHQSAAHYRSVLQYTDLITVEKRAELLDAFSDECDFADQIGDSEQAQREALRLWRDLGRRDKEGRALRHLSEIAIKLNRKAEVEHYINEAIVVLGMIPPSQELARAYSHKSRLHMVAGQYDETIHWGTRAVELAERLEDVEALVHALCNIGAMEMAYPRSVDEGKAKLERSLQVSLDHNLHNHAGRAYTNLGSGMLEARDFEASLRCLNEGIAYCVQNDIDYWRLGLLGFRARVHFRQGQWMEAEYDIHTAQEFWGTMETRSLVEPLLLRLQVRRGDPILPKALDAGRELARTTIMLDIACDLATLFAEMAWLNGNLEQCRSEVQSQFEIACQSNEPNTTSILAYWMWRAGAIKQPPLDIDKPYATQISGNWREAASMWEKYGCPYEQGMALMDGDEAAQLAALEIFERLGARPIIEKLKRQMRVRGICIPRGPRLATRENPYGLTAREMELIALIAQGKSNREISEAMVVSLRTVETYVTRILSKLSFDSRIQIAAWAVEKGLGSS